MSNFCIGLQFLIYCPQAEFSEKKNKIFDSGHSVCLAAHLSFPQHCIHFPLTPNRVLFLPQSAGLHRSHHMIPPHSSVCGRQARQRLSLRDKTLEESFDIKFGEEMQSLNYVLCNKWRKYIRTSLSNLMIFNSVVKQCLLQSW